MNLKEYFRSRKADNLNRLMGEAEPKGVILFKSLDQEILKELEQVAEALPAILDEIGEAKSSTASAVKNIGEQVDQVKRKLSSKQTRSFNSLQEVRSGVDHLANQINKLNDKLKDRDQVVKSLQERNQQLKQEFLFTQLIQPGASTLISIRDNLLDRLDHSDNKDEAKFLSTLQKHLLKALNEFKIEEISRENEQFDPSFQEVIDKKEVSKPERANSVLEVAQPGYKWRDKVIRPQRVIIGKFEGGDVDERKDSRN